MFWGNEKVFGEVPGDGSHGKGIGKLRFKVVALESEVNPKLKILRKKESYKFCRL